MAHPFKNIVGIDLGTSRTRIWSSGSDELIDEATALALDTQSTRVVAVGDAAAAMQGRVNDQLEIIFPVVGGEVQDEQYFKAFLKVLLQRVTQPLQIVQPTVMMSVPHFLTQAKREMVTQFLYELGMRQVYTMSQVLASAIGSGVPIADPSGSCVVSYGAGVIESGVISVGSVGTATNITIAGDHLSQKIGLHLQQHQGISVSNQTLQKVKKQVVSLDTQVTRSLVIGGQDVNSLTPREIEITNHDLDEVVRSVVVRQAELLDRTMQQIPPELVTDIVDKGILLTGAGAQLHGLAGYLSERVELPVAVVEKPDLAVINGVSTALQHLDEFVKSIGFLTH